MFKVNVKLDAVDKVKRFVNTITKFDVDMDLMHRKYVIDAKSIMGIFSLDLSKPLELYINTDDAGIMEEIKSAIREFIL